MGKQKNTCKPIWFLQKAHCTWENNQYIIPICIIYTGITISNSQELPSGNSSVVVELLWDEHSHFTVTNSGHIHGLERWTQILARNFPATGWQHTRLTRPGFNPASKEKGVLVPVSPPSAPTSILTTTHATELTCPTVKGGMGVWKMIFQRYHMADFPLIFKWRQEKHVLNTVWIACWRSKSCHKAWQSKSFKIKPFKCYYKLNTYYPSNLIS